VLVSQILLALSSAAHEIGAHERVESKGARRRDEVPASNCPNESYQWCCAQPEACSRVGRRHRDESADLPTSIYILIHASIGNSSLDSLWSSFLPSLLQRRGC